MNEEISELEDQSVNIYTEVKKISYNVSLINTRQLELFSRLENIEDLMKQIDKYFTG
jgi:predicted P-loop ATPase/GTPase